MDNLQICAPRPPQAALAKAIPALGEWRCANTLEIAARSAALTEVMASLQGWDVAALGAYFAFVRHPFADLSAFDAARRLARESGVITIPGSFFGNGLEGSVKLNHIGQNSGRPFSRMRPAGVRFHSTFS